MGVIGLVLLLVAGVVGLGVMVTGGGSGSSGHDAVAVPEAKLPELGDAEAGARRALDRRARARPGGPHAAS